MNYSTWDRYAFIWSEVRLVVAAAALLFGGVSPITLVTPAAAAATVSSLLTLGWVLSGAASLYLGWRWVKHNNSVFGGKNNKDIAAFLVLLISGVNLGLAGAIGINLGMTITNNYIVFVVVALLYLWAAVYLHHRWHKHNDKLF